ncbi:MAG: hypothetical protein Q7S12_04240 [bacterium]|nr:hypothetical protein [bacterium]
MSYRLTYEEPEETVCKKCKHKKIKFREEHMYFDKIDDNIARAECREFLSEDVGLGKRVKRKAVELVRFVNIEKL